MKTEVEIPEFVCPENCSTEIPHEPGLYFAATHDFEVFNGILEVYGRAPFLKHRFIELDKCLPPWSKYKGWPSFVVGPKIDVPAISLMGQSRDQVA